MLASSWIAEGLVKPVWHRLPVPSGKREELARLTGIPASNLSAMNTGNMPMTIEMARRIAAAVDGVSVLDLGAPEEEADDSEALLIRELRGRLEEIEEALRRLGPNLDLLGGLPLRVDALEKQAQPRTRRAVKA